MNSRLAERFFRSLGDERKAWTWLARVVGSSPWDGQLIAHKSRLGSFRCSKTPHTLNLREGTILEGKFPISKWLLSLLIVVDSRGLPTGHDLASALSKGKAGSMLLRGTSQPSAARIINRIRLAPVMSGSWWEAVAKGEPLTLPFVIIDQLADDFRQVLDNKDIPTPRDWRKWVGQDSPEGKEDEEDSKRMPALLPGHWDSDPFVGSRVKRRKAGSDPATWFRRGGFQKGHRLKEYGFGAPMSDRVIEYACSLHNDLRIRHKRPPKIVILKRTTLSAEIRGTVGGRYIYAAASPKIPVYFFYSQNSPDQNTHKRLLRDLSVLYGRRLCVLTDCKRFKNSPDVPRVAVHYLPTLEPPFSV